MTSAMRIRSLRFFDVKCGINFCSFLMLASLGAVSSPSRGSTEESESKESKIVEVETWGMGLGWSGLFRLLRGSQTTWNPTVPRIVLSEGSKHTSSHCFPVCILICS